VTAGLVAGVRAAAAGFLLAIASALPAAAEDVPVITLIIDDVGHDYAVVRRTLSLPPPFTAAILPASPYARAAHDEALAHGRDVMLHMPMEAGAAPAPGHPTLRADMDDAAIRRTLRRALDTLPGVIAVNNHEGSRLTTNRGAMEAVMDELRAGGPLIFIDSRTTAGTQAATAARAADLGTGSRDVFLDHDPSPAAVDRAFDHWLATARREGCALAIAHPRPATLAVLERRLPELADRFDRVDLATYIERCGKQVAKEE